MNKHLLILFGAVVVLLVPFVAFLVTQQGSQAAKVTVNNPTDGNTTQNQTSRNTNTYPNNGTAQADQQVTPTDTPNALTADQSAEQFYKYYFAASTNPLANGAYKDNKYLAQDFKDVISDLYKNGDTPVFCAKNQRPTIVVGQDKQVYSDGGYLTQVVISEAPPGSKQLYRVELQNLTGEWLIYDINCIK